MEIMKSTAVIWQLQQPVQSVKQLNTNNQFNF